MIKKLLTCVGAILITLSSCKTIPARWEKIEYTKRDSIVYNISYKDTIIKIPKQVASVDGVTVKVDTFGLAQLKPVKVKSGKAWVDVSIKDSKLIASGGCNEDSFKVLLREKETIINSLEQKNREKSKVVEKAYVPKVFQILSAIGVVFLFIIGLHLYKKFIP